MRFFDRLVRFLPGNRQSLAAGPAEIISDEGSSESWSTTQSCKPVVVDCYNPLPAEASELSLSLAKVETAAVTEDIESPRPSVVPAPQTAEGAFFDGDFDQDLDDVFVSLVSQNGAPVQNFQGEMVPEDQLAVENLFADIAANYARPVKNFIFELKRGTAVKDWVAICRPAMRGITRAAEGMGLNLASQRMLDFEAALNLAQASEQRVLNGEVRNLLLWCYEDLVKVMPQAFLVGEEEQQREGIIINSLLRQIPDVGLVTIEKLYSAGLTSLETLFLAERDDLAAATGIPPRISARICEKFQAYRTELQGSSRDVADPGQRVRLNMLLCELREHHEKVQQDSDNPAANPADKREFRRQRQFCMLRINILLAEIGELDLVSELHKLSFKRRLRRMEEHLATPAPAL